MDSGRLVDVKPRIADDADKIKSWKIPDISDSSQIKALRLPDSIAASKVGGNEFKDSHFTLNCGENPAYLKIL